MEAILEGSLQVLKPGGRMCIVDWKKKKMEIGPPLKIRFTKKRIGEVLRQTGYSQIKSLSPLLFRNAIIGVKHITGVAHLFGNK